MCSISAPVTPSFGVRVIARARAGEQLDFKCGPREQTRGGGRARRLCPSHTPAGLATLTKLYALRLRVRSAVRGFVGDADLDAGLALLIEHPPRPVAGTDREADDARCFRMPLNALHALPPKPKPPGAGDLHPEPGRATAAVQLQLAEAEQVADARCTAALAQAQDSARVCVGDVDGAAGICSHRRGERQHTVAPRPPPSLASGGPGADLKSVRAAGDHIATEGAHEGALGGELAHPGVDGLGDVDVASGIGTHAQHEAAHLSRRAARGTPLAAGGRVANLEPPTPSGNDVVAEGAHEGTLGGELADATVAIGNVKAAASGGLYVADGNSRISQFTTEGSFVRAFGYDVVPGGGEGFEICTAATRCKRGTSGGAAGQVSSFVLGVGADAAGNVYVAESGNSRVSQFTTEGSFVRAFGRDVIPGGADRFEVCTWATGCKRGRRTGGDRVLPFPSAVAADPGGAVYVADADAGRILCLGERGSTPCVRNLFGFRELKLDRSRGTARLGVKVPGPGRLRLRGKG